MSIGSDSRDEQADLFKAGSTVLGFTTQSFRAMEKSKEANEGTEPNFTVRLKNGSREDARLAQSLLQWITELRDEDETLFTAIAALAKDGHVDDTAIKRLLDEELIEMTGQPPSPTLRTSVRNVFLSTYPDGVYNSHSRPFFPEDDHEERLLKHLQDEYLKRRAKFADEIRASNAPPNSPRR